MHYRNGREAQNGDRVVLLETSGGRPQAVGTLANAVPGNDYCNGDILNAAGEKVAVACMCDCLHEDDVADVLAEKGLDKRPAGK